MSDVQSTKKPFDQVLEETARQIDGRPIPLHVQHPKVGHRPSLYSAELAENICRMLRKGNSLRTIAAQEGMPSKSTMLKWLDKNESFRDLYANAKRIGAEAIADELIDIADDSPADEFNKAKLRINTRQWIASRLLPSRYGEKSTIAHVNAPEPTNVTEICRRLAYLLNKPENEPKLIEAAPIEAESSDD